MKLLSSRNKPTIDATLRPHDLSLSDSCYTNTHDSPPFAADILNANVLLDFTSIILYCFYIPRISRENANFFFFSIDIIDEKRRERESEREKKNV